VFDFYWLKRFWKMNEEETNKEIKVEEKEINEVVCQVITYKEKYFEKIQIDKNLIQYNPAPMLIGESKIFYLNAKNESYYIKSLENPKLYIWLLRLPNDLKYTTKRIIETGKRMNIHVETVTPEDFELVTSSNGLESFFVKGMEFTKIKKPDCILIRIGNFYV
jgi:hypothetical protein